jgi:1-phosphofructokinase family hexose kinase
LYIIWFIAKAITGRWDDPLIAFFVRRSSLRYNCFMHLCLGTTPALQRTMTFARLVIDDVNRAIDLQINASGKSINVARVLATVGESVAATGFLGGDVGKLFRADLDAAHIQHDFIETASTTRTCITLIDRGAGHVTELVEEAGEVSPEETSELFHRFKAMLGGKKMLILSGSLAPGVPESFYAECCAAANDAKVPIILDARGNPLRHALVHRPFIVKHNRTELADTVGMPAKTPGELQKALAALIERGPVWAVITMGAEGAVASDGKSFWRISPLDIQVVSPIGSGDSFAAGLAAAVARGQSVPEACKLATACAAANALIPGSGLLRAEDVVRLEPLVVV